MNPSLSPSIELGLPPGGAPAAGVHHRALDGLRALSILLVLAAHLAPLGRPAWGLNVGVGVVGMALFFMLSGFLVTTQLLEHPSVGQFLLRRGARILPLGWLYMLIALTLQQADLRLWWHQLLFIANLPKPQPFTDTTAHLWSLCVEVQFYLLCATSVAVLGRRGLYVLPLLGLGITLWRVHEGVYASSYTLQRADEILAGALLALLWQQPAASAPRRFLAAVPIVPAALLFLLSCHEALGGLPYLRPYLAMLFVGACLAQPHSRPSAWLGGPRLAYVATVSFALYVWHPLLAHGSWLGSGETLERYLKRPLLVMVLFLIAHLSTFHYEQHWIRWARALSKRRRASAFPPPPAPLGRRPES